LKLLKSKRGAGLVDVIVTVLLLGTCGIVFSTTFPAGITCSRQAQEYKIASAIAQQKIEQVRAVGYQSLTYILLQSAGTIDADPTSSPFEFTSVDNVDGQLSHGSGSLTVANYSSDIKQVTVTVNWRSSTVPRNRVVQLITLIADKRTRRAT